MPGSIPAPNSGSLCKNKMAGGQIGHTKQKQFKQENFPIQQKSDIPQNRHAQLMMWSMEDFYFALIPKQTFDCFTNNVVMCEKHKFALISFFKYVQSNSVITITVITHSRL